MLESTAKTGGTPAQGGVGWALPAALIAVVLTLAASAVRLAPPAPKPASAPPGEFSAGRARAVLGQVVGDGRPHPVGSPADAAVRERIVANLRASGYEPKVEPGFACRYDVCAAVENVVAELPGSEPGQAVALTAHYDSVASGPGVSDDLSGVAAALEVARVLKAGPPPRNSILFLLDEGEEAGLLGAEAFVASSPEARRVRAVVNLDARGTSGRSLMFETSRDTGWLVPLFAASVPRPATSSLFALIYDLLPNDTDFTVFKRQGIAGFNFAFIGDPEHYHTVHDDLADLSLGSLQHHGDNALAVVRALAGADLVRGHRPGKVVFFDLLGFATVWWPAGWNLWLAVAGLILLLVAALRLGRKGLLPGRAFALGLAAWPLAVVATAVVGLLLALLLTLVGGLRVPWPARPFPAEATFWFLACTVALASVGWVRRAGFAGLWVGIWAWWGIAALLLSLSLPGASYLFVVPLVVAGLAGLVLPGGETGRAVATILPAVAAGVLWFPILVPLYEGLGAVLPVVVALAALVALAISPLLPALGASGPLWRFGTPALAGFLTAVMAVGVVVVPPFSPASPRRLNLVYLEDADAHEGKWGIPTGGALPPPLRKAATFEKKPGPPTAWSAPYPVYTAPAPDLRLAAPELTVLEDVNVAGKRHLRLRLRSARGAPVAILVIPGSAELGWLAVAGHELPTAGARDDSAKAGPPRRPAGGRILSVLTLPPAGIEIEAVVGVAEPQPWTVFDRTAGLPAPAAAALLEARPDTTVPWQDGDVTLVRHRTSI